MNAQRKWAIVWMTITVFVATAVFLPGLVHAGDLEPPTPPGVPTMHTLDEIYNIVLDTNSKVECEQPCPPCKEAPVAKTGQTTSYTTGDDGYLQKGVAWPDPRFTDHGDGTVTDNLTGLVWTKDANIYGERNWIGALLECASCREGGHSDWRLPNVRELLSLIDYGRYDPPLPDGHLFTNVQSSLYWSSTTTANYTSDAWYVTLYDGYANDSSKSYDRFVWCVRGGQ